MHARSNGVSENTSPLDAGKPLRRLPPPQLDLWRDRGVYSDAFCQSIRESCLHFGAPFSSHYRPTFSPVQTMEEDAPATHVAHPPLPPAHRSGGAAEEEHTSGAARQRPVASGPPLVAPPEQQDRRSQQPAARRRTPVDPRLPLRSDQGALRGPPTADAHEPEPPPYEPESGEEDGCEWVCGMSPAPEAEAPPYEPESGESGMGWGAARGEQRLDNPAAAKRARVAIPLPSGSEEQGGAGGGAPGELGLFVLPGQESAGGRVAGGGGGAVGLERVVDDVREALRRACLHGG